MFSQLSVKQVSRLHLSAQLHLSLPALRSQTGSLDPTLSMIRPSLLQVLVVVSLVAVVTLLLQIFFISSDKWSRSGLHPPSSTRSGLHPPSSTRSGLPSQMSQPSSCSCHVKALLQDYIPKEQLEAVKQRRAQQYQEFKLRNPNRHPRLLYALANSPLQFPIQGYIVQPLTPTLIPDLALHADTRSSYKVFLKVSRGILTSVLQPNVRVKGFGTTELSIESSSLQSLNDQLEHLMYRSSEYHIDASDLATFQFEDHEAFFSISIKQPKVPILWDMGTDINSQVTVTTKTFMRYSKLRLLLHSIRQFYPKIPIIIADDSIKPEAIAGENIEHHIMPAEKGWFAGRNLAVSQVTTKYFLWVDDDFLFSGTTKIEKFVEVMEANPELDMVGGDVMGSRFHFTVDYQEGDEAEGGCMHTHFGRSYNSLPGYPQCSMVNGVTNFFLARTDAIRRVRFDPKLQRVAHHEIFTDGLGTLMIASCRDPDSMSVRHQPHRGNSAAYNKFRYVKNRDSSYRFNIYYFKNYLKCMRL